MPLQEQVVDIPIVGGVDEGNSPKLTTRLLSARNCRYSKPGEIWKRYGATILASTNARLALADAEPQDSTTPPECTTLLDYGGELVRIGGGELDAFAPYSGDEDGLGATDWAYRGRVPECVTRVTPVRPVVTVPSDNLGQPYDRGPEPQVASDGGTWSACVFAQTITQADGSHLSRVFVTLRNEDTSADLLSAYELPTATADECYEPQCHFSGNKLYCFWYDQTTTSIDYRSLDLISMTWSAVSTIPGVTLDIFNAPLYDVVPYALQAGFFAVVYVRSLMSGFQAEAFGLDATANTITTPTFVGPAAGTLITAVAIDGVSADGRIWTAVGFTGASAIAVYLDTAELTLTDCNLQAAAAVPFIDGPAASNSFIAHVGITRTAFGAAVVQYTVAGAAPLLNNRAGWREWTRETSTPFADAPATDERLVREAKWISRIHLRNARAYAWMQAGDTHAMVDISLGEDLPDNGSPRVVSVAVPDLIVPGNDPNTLRAYGLARGYELADVFAIGTVVGPGVATGALYRRNVVRLDTEFGASTNAVVAGNTTVLAGGCVSAYDGSEVFDIGYLYRPRIWTAVPSATVGNMTPEATYGYAALWSWRDANSNEYRSAVGEVATVALGVGETAATVTVVPLNVTNKYSPIACRLYRTLADGNAYYFVAELENVINDEAGIVFEDTDGEVIVSNEALSVFSSEVANSHPPSAAFVHMHQSRVWLADVDNDSLWYSKPVTSLDGVAFSDEFTFDPFDQPRLVALATLDDKLVLFRTRRTYVLVGEGPDNTNATGAFSTIQAVQSDVGCSDTRSVVTCSHGVFFNSEVGLMLLARGMELLHVGHGIEDTLGASTIVNACYSPQTQCVRFVLDRPDELERGIVLEYDVNSGSPAEPVWTTHDYIDEPDFAATITASCTWRGRWTFINDGGRVFFEDTSTHLDTSSTDGVVTIVFVPMSGQLSWTKLAGLNGTQRVWYASLLADYVDDHDMSVSVFTDFKSSADQTATWPNADLSVEPTRQLRIHVREQECTALSLSWSVTQAAEPIAAGTGKSCVINGISLEVGVESGVRKQRASRSR